jgi:hypothetical protein
VKLGSGNHLTLSSTPSEPCLSDDHESSSLSLVFTDPSPSFRYLKGRDRRLARGNFTPRSLTRAPLLPRLLLPLRSAQASMFEKCRYCSIWRVSEGRGSSSERTHSSALTVDQDERLQIRIWTTCSAPSCNARDPFHAPAGSAAHRIELAVSSAALPTTARERRSPVCRIATTLDCEMPPELTEPRESHVPERAPAPPPSAGARDCDSVRSDRP